MVTCSVIGCKNNSNQCADLKNGITFHQFPVEARRRYKWLLATGKPNNWFPNKYSTICSKHFKPYCFKSQFRGRTKLFNTAVPTECLVYSHSTSTHIFGSNDYGINTEETTSCNAAKGSHNRGRCRCCLIVGYHSTMNTSFQDINTKTVSYTEMLQSMYHLNLTRIRLGDNEKLQLICRACEERLQSAYNFYLKIQASEETLQRQLNMTMSKSKDQRIYIELTDKPCYVFESPEFALEELYKIFADRPPSVLNKLEHAQESLNEETKEKKRYPIWDDTDDDSDVIIEKDIIEKVDITNEFDSKMFSEELGDVAVTASKMNVSEKIYKKEPEDLGCSSNEDSPKDYLLNLDDDIVTKDTSKISFNDKPAKPNTAVPIKTVLGKNDVTANNVTDLDVDSNAPIRIKTELEDGFDATETNVSIKTDYDNDIVKHVIKTEPISDDTAVTAQDNIEDIESVAPLSINKNSNAIVKTSAQDNIEDIESVAPLSINKNINAIVKTSAQDNIEDIESVASLSIIKSSKAIVKRTEQENIEYLESVPQLSIIKTSKAIVKKTAQDNIESVAPLSINKNSNAIVKTYKPLRTKQTKVTSSIANTDDTIDMNTSAPIPRQYSDNNRSESIKSKAGVETKFSTVMNTDKEVIISENKRLFGSKMYVKQGSIGDPLNCGTKIDLDGAIVTHDNPKTDSNAENVKAKTPVQTKEVDGNVVTKKPNEIHLDVAAVTEKATECEKAHLVVKKNTTIPTEIGTTSTAVGRKADINDIVDMFQDKECKNQFINNAVMKTNIPVLIKHDLNDTNIPTNTQVLIKTGLEGVAVTHQSIKADLKDGVATTDTEVWIKTEIDNPVVNNITEEVKIEFGHTEDTTKEPIQIRVKDSQYYINDCIIKAMPLKEVGKKRRFNDSSVTTSVPFEIHDSSEGEKSDDLDFVIDSFKVAKKRHFQDTSVTKPNEKKGTVEAPSIEKKVATVETNIVLNKLTKASTSSANIDDDDTINMGTSVPIEIYSDSSEGENSDDPDFVMDSVKEVAKKRCLKDTSVTTPNEKRVTVKAPSIKKKIITIAKKSIVQNKPAKATTSSINIVDTTIDKNIKPNYMHRFPCVYCQDRFKTKRIRSAHYKKCTVLKREGLKMKCSFCLAVMGNNYQDISDHMLKAHGFKTVVHNKIEPTESVYNTVEISHDTRKQVPKISRVVSGSQPLKCPKCEMTFDLSVKMSEHMLSAHRTSNKPGNIMAKIPAFERVHGK